MKCLSQISLPLGSRLWELKLAPSLKYTVGHSWRPQSPVPMSVCALSLAPQSMGHRRAAWTPPIQSKEWSLPALSHSNVMSDHTLRKQRSAVLLGARFGDSHHLGLQDLPLPHHASCSASSRALECQMFTLLPDLKVWNLYRMSLRVEVLSIQ